VRRRIVEALASGQQAGPDGRINRWTMAPDASRNRSLTKPSIRVQPFLGARFTTNEHWRAQSATWLRGGAVHCSSFTEAEQPNR
jgi:hypothetical protein